MPGQDEPTNEELVEKIEELEQRQEEQESMMQRMMPDRRQALKGLGLLGGGALLGSSSASGATGSAGQIGTSTDRPDIYGDVADVNSVSTASATIGGTDVNGVIQETGKVDHGSVSAGSFSIVSVSFSTSFSNAPIMYDATQTPDGTGTGNKTGGFFRSISSTGFESFVYNDGSDTTNLVHSWGAVK